MQTAPSWNPAPGLPAGRRRRRADPTKLALVGAVTTIGAIGSLWTDAAPTSTATADALWRAALVAVAALAGSRARRWTLVWGSAVALAGVGGAWIAAAAVALLVSLGLFVFRFRDRVAGAVVGALVGLSALQLERPSLTWATAVLAAVALAPMLLSGYRRSRSRTRRAVRFGAVALVVLAIAALAGAATFGLEQRRSIEQAVELTRDAVAALGEDDTGAARAGFEEAAAAFAEVRDAADAPWLLPARVTPAVGANVQMARTAASVGAELNVVADDLAGSLDPQDLRAPDGSIDLAVLAAMSSPVERAGDAIDSARVELDAVDSPWLLGPLRSGYDELTDELVRTADSAELAALAVDRAPELLGAAGPRRYLMLLGNPAETRDLGGHIGNWAELRAEDGRLTMGEVGSPYELASPSTDPPLQVSPGDYPQALVEMRPQYHPQNWGATADFPSVARLAADLYPQARPGSELDGVLYADPEAFAALLRFTGPVAVPGTDLTIGPGDAAQFLTVGQFAAFPTESEADRAVSDLVETVVGRFTSSQLPSPRTLSDVLGPLVEEGRLQFASLHDADRPLLDRLGLLGQVERPENGGDLLSVATRNTNPSKMDAYLQRRVEYRAHWNPITGVVEGTLRIELTNGAPSEGLPAVVANPIPGLDPGTNRTTVSVLSASGVRSVTVDGESATAGTLQELPGIRRHSVLVDVPAGDTAVVELELRGQLNIGGAYRLQWVGQPAVDPGEVQVTVSTDDGSGEGPGPRSFTLDGARDELVTVRGTPT